MKKLTLAMLLSLIICTILNVYTNAEEVDAMTDKLIRLHVIANSDSEADQALKLRVRDRILATAEGIFDEAHSKTDAMQLIEENLPLISAAAESEIAENGYDYGVICTVCREDFSERHYSDFTLPAGEYDSLCIRIGEADGKNWWCVCYPNLCVGAAMKIDDCEVFTEGELTIVKQPEKVRYKLWCFEFVRKIRSFLQ